MEIYFCQLIVMQRKHILDTGSHVFFKHTYTRCNVNAIVNSITSKSLAGYIVFLNFLNSPQVLCFHDQKWRFTQICPFKMAISCYFMVFHHPTLRFKQYEPPASPMIIGTGLSGLLEHIFTYWEQLKKDGYSIYIYICIYTHTFYHIYIYIYIHTYIIILFVYLHLTYVCTVYNYIYNLHTYYSIIKTQTSSTRTITLGP